MAFRRALAEVLAPLALVSDRKCVSGTDQSESSGERVGGSCGFRAKKVLALLSCRLSDDVMILVSMVSADTEHRVR